MSEVAACLDCGTCCFSRLAAYVPVSGNDYARLGEAAVALVDFDGHRAYMRMNDGHCAALGLDAPGGAFVCTAYATRPDACRDLERGSAACLGELATKGERPLLQLRKARQEATLRARPPPSFTPR